MPRELLGGVTLEALSAQLVTSASEGNDLCVRLQTIMARAVSVPIWLLGVCMLLVGAGAGAGVTLAMSSHDSSPAAQKSHVSTSKASQPITSSPPAPVVTVTTTATVTQSPPRTPTATPTKTQTPTPRGSVAVSFPGNDYGQSTAHAQCSDWLLRFTNNSDTEVVEITWPTTSGSYEDDTAYNSKTNSFPTVPASVRPAVIDVSIPPYQYQDVRFQTCTTTPVPAGANFEFSANAPSRFTWKWLGGTTG